jgi:hypothetical protein
MRFDPQVLSHLDFGAPQTSNYDVCATRMVKNIGMVAGVEICAIGNS